MLRDGQLLLSRAGFVLYKCQNIASAKEGLLCEGEIRLPAIGLSRQFE